MLIQHTKEMAPAFPADPKPLLRGWFHAAAAIGAIALTAILLWRSQGDMPRQISLLIYGASTIVLYTGSAVYHIGPWSIAARRRLRAFDRANIYVQIAGTYTPLCFNMLSGWLRAGLLAAIWTLAVAGVIRVILRPHTPRLISTLLYVGMGWLAILAFPALIAEVPMSAILWMLAAGAVYMAGALVYVRRWPNPYPRVFGFHEIFHLLVIAGGLIVFGIIWVWALPYPRV